VRPRASRVDTGPGARRDLAGEKHGSQQIVQRIALTRVLSEREHAYLLNIAERCPVHRTLVRSDLRVLTEADERSGND
jgi:hypothetical protein